MSERDTKIIEAAQALFMRYGVGKTTMNDIAREAGVARQTLYNAYPGKDEVLRAAVRTASEHCLCAVSDAWEVADSFEDKLEAFFQIGPLSWYDMVQAAPDGAEMFEGIHKVASEELQQMNAVWVERFEALIQDVAAPGSAAQKNTAELAEYLYATAANAKYNAEDRKTVETRLEMLKLSVMALL